MKPFVRQLHDYLVDRPGQKFYRKQLHRQFPEIQKGPFSSALNAISGNHRHKGWIGQHPYEIKSEKTAVIQSNGKRQLVYYAEKRDGEPGSPSKNTYSGKSSRENLDLEAIGKKYKEYEREQKRLIAIERLKEKQERSNV